MPKPLKPCRARQYADQMSCGACGLTWDVNDPDPPTCRPIDGRVKAAKPIETDILDDMLREYEENGAGRGGMAAVRQLLASKGALFL